MAGTKCGGIHKVHLSHLSWSRRVFFNMADPNATHKRYFPSMCYPSRYYNLGLTNKENIIYPVEVVLSEFAELKNFQRPNLWPYDYFIMPLSR